MDFILDSVLLSLNGRNSLSVDVGLQTDEVFVCNSDCDTTSSDGGLTEAEFVCLFVCWFCQRLSERLLTGFSANEMNHNANVWREANAHSFT